MFYVYVLKTTSKERVYVGFTKDLRRRLKEHLEGQSYATKRMGNLKLIYYEAFMDKRDAIRREKYLKTTKGKRMLKLALKYSLGPVVPQYQSKLGTWP